jgi:hypothetical protein
MKPGFAKCPVRVTPHGIAARLNYSKYMNVNKSLLSGGKYGMLLATAAVSLLTGCTAYVDGPHAEIAGGPTVFVDQDDYIYYPGYDVYYSDHRHQYAYREGQTWVSRPAPRGVSVDALRASPSVKMDFHDSPVNHHSAVVKQYPKNWTPPRSNPGHPEAHGDEQHGDHGGK